MLHELATPSDSPSLPPRSQPRPYFPTVSRAKQNPWQVYRSVKKDRLRLATADFYDAALITKNLGLVRMLWPLTEPGIKHVLRDNAANYERPPFIRSTISSIEGEGLLSATGERALRLRKIVAGAFGQKNQLSGHDAFLVHNAVLLDQVGEHERTRQSFDLETLLAAWAVNVNVTLIFSDDALPYQDSILHLVRTRAENFSRDAGFIVSLPKTVPTPARLKLWKARKSYLRLAHDLLQQRRGRPSDRDDLLNRLISARDEATGEGLTDDKIVDFTITFLSAGIETTAAGLAATLYLLAFFPEIQARVREEALSVFGEGRPSPEDFSKLIYTQAVVDESLRYYPPAPITARQAQADDETPFGPVKAGDHVSIFIWCVHHNSLNWDAPREFRPERFLPGNVAKVPTYAYLPFGRGPRQCLGRQIARRGITLAAAELLANFDLALDRGRPFEIRGGYSLLFPFGLHVAARRYLPSGLRRA